VGGGEKEKTRFGEGKIGFQKERCFSTRQFTVGKEKKERKKGNGGAPRWRGEKEKRDGSADRAEEKFWH